MTKARNHIVWQNYPEGKYFEINTFVLVGINVSLGKMLKTQNIFLVPKTMFDENEDYWINTLNYSTLYDEIELPKYEMISEKGQSKKVLAYDDKILRIGWKAHKNDDTRIISEFLIDNNKRLAWNTIHSQGKGTTYKDMNSKQIVLLYEELNKLIKEKYNK